MKLPVNLDIAQTHIVKGKRQTLVASLGVAIGVAVYLFMNSLSSGFSGFSRDNIFKSNAHIKIYKNDELSKPLAESSGNSINIIRNPQIITRSKTLINPDAILNEIKKESYITNAIAQIDFTVFYNRGNTQVKGSGTGVNMTEYSAMFNTQKYMVGGKVTDLQGNLNGVIIGSGIADKLNLGIGDNVTMSSSYGVTKVLRIVGIFTLGNSITDDSKSFVNISTAQQFQKEGPAFVTTIYANTINADITDEYVKKLQLKTDYTVEDWKTTNADVISGDVTRSTMMNSISLSILLLAGFIIYNILSSTISQKINDIAILKATGFSSKDVIKIFLLEALIMGIIGTLLGLCLGSILISILSGVYMGPPVGYFPITFEFHIYLRSFVLGLFMTIAAGFFPARRAANLDPVEIFRK
jgi:lipoprotein-releasing system permease protein